MRWVGVFSLAVVLAGTAIAQDQDPAKDGDSISAMAGDDTLTEASSLSHEEKKQRAEAMLAEMRQALQRATEILGEARAAKDVVQLNCVNEKLVQIKGLLKIGEQSSVRMYEAMAAAADDVINHEYTKLAVAHQKTTILRAEADQCVGENTIYTGETEIEVEIDPALQQGDPTATPFPDLAPETPEVTTAF
jgi:hypothetical protein